MQKFKRKMLPILILATFVPFLFSGCVSLLLPPSPIRNEKSLDLKEIPDPENSTLFFGHLYMNETITISGIEFIQIDPAYEPARITPGASKTMMWFTPVKVGTTHHLINWVMMYGATVIYYPGLMQSKQTITLKSEKPGLHYFGAYCIERDPSSDDAYADRRLERTEEYSELEALLLLKPRVANTSWEPLVNARIKELGDE